MAYYLKKYTPVKSNYEIYNKDLLVIMSYLKVWDIKLQNVLKGFCHGASCLQANGAEGRKTIDWRRKKEKEKEGLN